jgi:hypothetical protein
MLKVGSKGGSDRSRARSSRSRQAGPALHACKLWGRSIRLGLEASSMTTLAPCLTRTPASCHHSTCYHSTSTINTGNTSTSSHTHFHHHDHDHLRQQRQHTQPASHPP